MGVIENNLAETIVSVVSPSVILFEFQSDGVFVGSGALVNQTSGTIEAAGVAAYAANIGGFDSTIENAGLMEGLSSTSTATETGVGTNSTVSYSAFGNGAQLGVVYGVISPSLTNTLINTGLIEGGIGVQVSGQATIDNTGTIASLGTITTLSGSSPVGGASGIGVYVAQTFGPVSGGGQVTNNGSLLLDNSGLISGASTVGVGVRFDAGMVTNEKTGTITAEGRAIITGAPGISGGPAVGGTVVNYGLVVGGVYGGAGASVFNQLGGVIDGGVGSIGVTLNDATLTDFGTISASSAAVAFGTAGGTVVVEPGAVFVGSIDATSTLDVVMFAAPTAGASISLSSAFGGGGAFEFAGSSITVEGSVSQLAAGAPLSGLTIGDTIKLDGFAAISDSFVNGVGLELFSGTSAITLDIQGSFNTSDFTVTDPPSSTTIVVSGNNPCFAAGTELLTVDGPTPVEALRVGDQLVLHGGGRAPVVWLGRPRIDLRRHVRPEAVQPIVIEAGAIGDGVPARRLVVSPDHALYLEGHLVPAKALVNGVTIRQENWRGVTYFHVELPTHAVIYAEGCPAESYLDCGNRSAFSGGAAMMLHPDFAQAHREAFGCAPFAEAGAIIEGLRTRILARAAMKTTDDAAIELSRRHDGAWVIRSRSAIPGEVLPDPRDRRRLGVKLAALRAGERVIPLDHPALVEGWHTPESDGRWTDGEAVVPAHLLDGATLDVTVSATVPYRLDGDARAVRAS